MRLRLLIGLFLLILLPARAHAFGDCSDAAYLANFDVTERVRSCEIRSLDPLRFTGRTRDVRVFRINGASHGDDDRWISDINAALGQISFALEALSPRLDSANISILLSDDRGRGLLRGAHGVTYTGRRLMTTFGRSLEMECPIVVYKIGGRVSNEVFASLLAHEIFHCVQDATWPDKASSATGDWWIEGSAEYFAQLVVPNNRDTRGYIRQFGDNTAENSLYAPPMDYENVVFFDWLHSRGGGDAVIEFINSIPDTGDSLSFLQRRFSSDDWVEFIELYASNRLTQPNGTVINAGQPARYVPVQGDSGGVNQATDAFRGLLIELRFPDQGRYEISIDGGDALRAKYRRGGSDWQDLTQVIESCTDQSSATLYVVTTGEPDSFNINYRRVEPCSTCEIAPQMDRCLVGTWTLTGGGPVEWLRANGMGDMAQIEVSEMSVRMGSNGRYVQAPVTVLMQAGQDGVVIDGVGVGTEAGGTWSASDGILNICPQTAAITATVSTPTHSMTQMFGAGPEMLMTYTCSASTLNTTLEIAAGIPPMDFVYTRADR